MAINSEPSGTDADIPFDPALECATDIYILCGDAGESRQLSGQLTTQGYRVTSFFESAELLESLRAGKPNLLICDTTGPDQDGYTVCREIKSDNDLWRIPVLLITGVSSLGDLLIVLDSNADNFIARPYDPQYLVSLVEMVLSSPVERPDPEKVRTQFKIRHEDREYVIAADRRKLLEFLLSSFEIAVGRAADLEQTKDTLENLRATLEQRVTDRTAELRTGVARLQTLANGQSHDLEATKNALAGLKEEREALRSQIEEREKVIAGTKDDLAGARQELENARARIAEAEDTIRTLGTEKDELEHALRGDAESLNRDLEQSRADLASVKKDLADVSAQRAVLESDLATVTGKFEDAKKEISARAIELQQVTSALAAEKNRADNSEQEVKSILQEKARAEQDLRQMIEDITGKATQQSQECLRLTDELDAEKDRCAAREQQYGDLVQEAAKKEAAFAAEKGTLMEHHEVLQQKYDALTEQIGAERQKTAAYEADLAAIRAAHEKLAGEFQEQKRLLDTAATALERENTLRTGAEKNLQETIAAKDSEVGALTTTIGDLRQNLEKAREDFVQLQEERDNALGAHRSLNDELAAARTAQAQADKAASSAASETEQVHNELETERRLRHAVEEKLSDITRVKETVERNLSATGEENAVRERGQLAKIQELSDALRAGQEAYRAVSENLARTIGEKEAAEQRLKAADEERAAEVALQGETLKKLGDDLKTALDRQRSLEEQLREAEHEQAEKEAVLRDLETRMEEAASALAAEKERRHAAEAACREAKDTVAALKNTAPVHPVVENPPAEGRVVIVKEPALPAIIAIGPHALLRKGIDPVAPVPVREADEPSIRIRSVEDLFEDPKELDVHDLPDAAQRTGVSMEGKETGPNQDSRGSERAPIIVEEVIPDDEYEPAGEQEPDEPVQDGEPDPEEAGPESGSDEGDEEEPEPATEGNLTFGRQQWFDLVRWAHNSGSLSHEDRLRIVKLGRLIQKGRQLTGRQEAQLAELVTLAHTMGYRPKE
ncbi:MAG: response regulator [Methanoregula sp.]|nr:response regulator [Methanoregula sp.]